MFSFSPRLITWPYLVKRKCLQKSISRYVSTIYALSSGQGKCGVALVRVTGDNASDVLTSMTIPRVLPQPRMAALRRIIHPVTGEGLDRALVLWFPGPHSFTGEDSCELHIHGGPAVISAVLSALSSVPGCHPAQPGDFTKRAFYNGKLDLTSVEGLGDLIHAETEAQRKQALQQMEGALGQLYTGWRQMLLHCRANLEAFIDFSEDENIEEGVVEEVETKIKKIIKEMEDHLSDDRRGERLRSGLQLAILGRPNVGKSSFLNALVQRPAAIVSPIPGTTRDIVETTIDLGGYPVVLSDTAGLRHTDDDVETEGIKRAIARSKQADVAVVLMEASEVLPLIKQGQIEWNKFLSSYFIDLGIDEESDMNALDCTESSNWITNKNFITLINKIDLIECEEDKALLENVLKDSSFLISIKTKEGFDSALHKLKDICSSLCKVGTAENPTLTASRHRTHISSCLKSLKLILGNGHEKYNYNIVQPPQVSNHSVGSTISDLRVNKNHSRGHQESNYVANFDDFEDNLLHSEETLLLAAHHLQRATNHLGYVTGHVTTEDVLDHIFSAFCIGK